MFKGAFRRPSRRVRRGAVALAIAATALPIVVLGGASPASAAGPALYGLRTGGVAMVRFDASAPATAVDVPLTGLAAGDALRGIDVRPSDGQLYGLGSGFLYRINAITGAATQVATSGSSFTVDIGFDINPVTDQMRGVASLGANAHFVISTGVGTFDTTINPAGFSISGLAYTPANAGKTTLYGIDTTGDRLVLIGGPNGVPSPNGGVATPVGFLGFNTNSNVGFDIAPSGAAYASLTSGTTTKLFTINLANGLATEVGTVAGAPLIGLAAGPLDTVTRLSGADRIDTAVATSKSSFPVASSAPSAVLARSDVAADALAGTPLAKVAGGPLLLTPSGVLDGRTQTELKRVLGPTGKTVHILGGPAAISDAVKAQIEGLGYVTSRHGGTDRFDTATKIAEAVGAPGTVFLADGTEFADALIAGVAASKAGGVVLLTNGPTMPSSTSAYLTAHPGTQFTLGASGTALPSGTVIAGADPYARSVSLATQFWSGSFATVGFASGEAFPDGLTGGAQIAHIGGPLFLVTAATAPSVVTDYLAANNIALNNGFVYGGSARISDAVVAALQAAIS
jgi:hypothetical protein